MNEPPRRKTRCSMPRLPVVASLILVGSLLAGCKQGLIDRCQLTSDCEAGLVCMRIFGGTGATDGVCVTGQGDGGPDMPQPPPDMQMNPDVEMGDAADVSTDTPPVDMGRDGDMVI